HRRIGRNRPRGVAPSPSNLLARIPPRPSTTGSASGPASRMPRVGLPGRARTRIREKARRRMEQTFGSEPMNLSYKKQTGLLFYPRMLYFARAPFRGDANPGAEE